MLLTAAPLLPVCPVSCSSVGCTARAHLPAIAASTGPGVSTLPRSLQQLGMSPSPGRDAPASSCFFPSPLSLCSPHPPVPPSKILQHCHMSTSKQLRNHPLYNNRAIKAIACCACITPCLASLTVIGTPEGGSQRGRAGPPGALSAPEYSDVLLRLAESMRMLGGFRLGSAGLLGQQAGCHPSVEKP